MRFLAALFLLTAFACAGAPPVVVPNEAAVMTDTNGAFRRPTNFANLVLHSRTNGVPLKIRGASGMTTNIAEIWNGSELLILGVGSNSTVTVNSNLHVNGTNLINGQLRIPSAAGVGKVAWSMTDGTLAWSNAPSGGSGWTTNQTNVVVYSADTAASPLVIQPRTGSTNYALAVPGTNGLVSSTVGVAVNSNATQLLAPLVSLSAAQPLTVSTNTLMTYSNVVHLATILGGSGGAFIGNNGGTGTNLTVRFGLNIPDLNNGEALWLNDDGVLTNSGFSGLPWLISSSQHSQGVIKNGATVTNLETRLGPKMPHLTANELLATDGASYATNTGVARALATNLIGVTSPLQAQLDLKTALTTYQGGTNELWNYDEGPWTELTDPASIDLSIPRQKITLTATFNPTFLNTNNGFHCHVRFNVPTVQTIIITNGDMRYVQLGGASGAYPTNSWSGQALWRFDCVGTTRQLEAVFDGPNMGLADTNYVNAAVAGLTGGSTTNVTFYSSNTIHSPFTVHPRAGSTNAIQRWLNTNGTELVRIESNGVFTGTSASLSEHLTASGNVTAGGVATAVEVRASNFYFGFGSAGGRGWIHSPSDGVFTLFNSATTDFGRLNYGGVSDAYPAIKRNGAGIDIRRADDSGYASLVASNVSLGLAQPLTVSTNTLLTYSNVVQLIGAGGSGSGWTTSQTNVTTYSADTALTPLTVLNRTGNTNYTFAVPGTNGLISSSAGVAIGSNSTRLLLPSGSAGSPSLTFNSDNGTGLYKSGSSAGTVGVSTNLEVAGYLTVGGVGTFVGNLDAPRLTLPAAGYVSFDNRGYFDFQANGEVRVVDWGNGAADIFAGDFTGSNIVSTAGALKIGPSPAAITNILSASATLNFAAQTLGSVEDLPITCTGASSGDIVSVGVPQPSATGIIGSFSGFASNNTVFVRFLSTGTSQDPASGTFKVLVTKVQ